MAEPENPMPFIAPCNDLSLDAPFRWLKLGLQDVQSAPIISMGFGTVMSAMIMAVTIMAWQYGSAWIMLSLLCGFVFIAPLACVCTYAISAQLERGMEVSLRRTLRACLKRYIGTELVFALILLVIFLVWARASSMASIFIPSGDDYSLEEMGSYLLTLSIVAVLFLSITFSASVFSLPMIMHRNVDAVTAVVTSINAVMRNKFTMMTWGVLIFLSVVIGIATLGLGLVVLLPAIGHAVWHGYLETINADEFPRHEIGITATARPTQ